MSLSGSERSEPLAEPELRVVVDNSSVREVNTALSDNRGVFAVVSDNAWY